MKKAKQVFGLSTIVSIFLLTGCGGGGSASGTGTGYLTDAAMKGVPYTCSDDHFGNTGDDGSFTFKVGSDCTFKFGTDEVTVASSALTKSGNVVTPLDIEEIKSDTEKVTRFLRLVQSLDNASDGVIDLSSLEDQNVDLLNTLASDSSLESTYNSIVGEFGDAEGSLVTASAALDHFMDSVQDNSAVVDQLEAIEDELKEIDPTFSLPQEDSTTEDETVSEDDTSTSEDDISCQNVNPITGQCEDSVSDEEDEVEETPVEEEEEVVEEETCQNINPITGQCED